MALFILSVQIEFVQFAVAPEEAVPLIVDVTLRDPFGTVMYVAVKLRLMVEPENILLNV
jgi:hypothetical protein